MSTKEQRNEWQRLHGKTRTAWQAGTAGNANVVSYDGDDISPVAVVDNPTNRAFIIAAHEAVPELLQDVERLTTALEAARAGICTISCAKVARLREENAALREERKRLVEKMAHKTAKYIGWGESDNDQYAATKAALGRAHAALRGVLNCVPPERQALSQLSAYCIEARAVLADLEGRAAAEYVARLEKALREISVLDCSFEKYERVPAVEIAREALGTVEQ